MKVKFGVEEGKVPFTPNFTHIGATIRV